MSEAKPVLVIGGARGIGAGITRRLVAEGYDVTFTSRAATDASKALIDELGGKPSHMALDSADTASIASFLESYEPENPIYGLVYCAGQTYDTLGMMADPAKVADTIQVNFGAMVQLVGGVARSMMRARDGRVVGISSISASRPIQGNSIYAASKGAMESYMRALALELGRKKITANTIAPGLVITEMTDKYPAELVERVTKLIPLGRCGSPEDVSGLVNFLLSEDAQFLTGQTITLDGGQITGQNIG